MVVPIKIPFPSPPREHRHSHRELSVAKPRHSHPLRLVQSLHSSSKSFRTITESPSSICRQAGLDRNPPSTLESWVWSESGRRLIGELLPSVTRGV
jgi:hypothetical protein